MGAVLAPPSSAPDTTASVVPPNTAPNRAPAKTPPDVLQPPRIMVVPRRAAAMATFRRTGLPFLVMVIARDPFLRAWPPIVAH